MYVYCNIIIFVIIYITFLLFFTLIHSCFSLVFVAMSCLQVSRSQLAGSESLEGEQSGLELIQQLQEEALKPFTNNPNNFSSRPVEHESNPYVNVSSSSSSRPRQQDRNRERIQLQNSPVSSNLSHVGSENISPIRLSRGAQGLNSRGRPSTQDSQVQHEHEKKLGRHRGLSYASSGYESYNHHYDNESDASTTSTPRQGSEQNNSEEFKSRFHHHSKSVMYALEQLTTDMHNIELSPDLPDFPEFNKEKSLEHVRKQVT